jgi:thioredoxin reductase
MPLHHFPFLLRGWTRDVVVLTNGEVEIAAELRGRLVAAGIHVEERRVARLVARDGHLESIALADGGAIPCGALFVHPPQRQVALVTSLGVALDEHGCVRVDPMTRETSIPGVYAAGDLATKGQAAILAAAAGMQAAAALNAELSAEMATAGLV